jgi:DNA invertase Pin-like site-specific DNA recombinase
MQALEPAVADLPQSKGNATRAAEYVRMSTEHQQYSTENQRDAIQRYAEQHGMVIVKTYTDAGKSGLRIKNRDALKQLINDVETNQADYSVVLVYDVSRWGRFQDADESAYYEYICRRAKIDVHYCAEQFENDGSPISTIVKGLKRAMAGEYSRELSTKVFTAQCRLIKLGFRPGGSPGYGLRRMLRDATGKVKGILDRGEHKSIATDRVILVPGPKEEIEIILWMYHAFIEENISESQLARILNQRGILNSLGRPWNQTAVHRVLTSEKYIGNNVYNRASFRLKKRRMTNTPDMWIRSNGAFNSVVPIDLFLRAQAIIRERNRTLTDDDLLQLLRGLLARKGYLSQHLINDTEGMPCGLVYRKRFGSLIRAYTLIGYPNGRNCQPIDTGQQLRLTRFKVVADIIESIRRKGGAVHTDSETDLLTVNGEFTVSIVIARCKRRKSGAFRWLIRLDAGLKPDITLAVRMDAGNTDPLDYYLLPSQEVSFEKLWLAEDNAGNLDTYRFSTLDIFSEMAHRARIPEAVWMS